MKNRKSSVLVSVIAMLLSMAMLVGTTLAWFSDSAASAKNIVQTGTLDVDLEYMDGENGWKSVKQGTNLFKPNALWEPGHTEVVYLRVANKGTLALQYQLGVGVALEVSSTNVEGDPFKLSDYIHVGAVEGVEQPFASRQAARMAVSQSGKLNGGYAQTGELLPHEAGAAPDYDYVALVVYMPESVGNEANAAVGATQPQITLGVELYATQFTSEQDAFGDDYDLGALFPKKTLNEKFSFAVAADENGVVTQPVTIESRSISVTVPAGVQLEDGVTELTATVTDKDRSASNLQPGENQQLRALDVHIEGIAAGNTVPVIVDLGEVVPASLNIGNLTMHHVENGATNPMTRVMDKAELDAHNEFYYEITTGKVIVALASFSEVAVVSDTTKAWEGNFDYSWYNGAVMPLAEGDPDYVIANADQLAAFGAIVGGMDGQTQDSFSGKIVKLVADINLGDDEEHNNSNIIFYPIGYHNSTGSYEKTSGGSVTSNVSSFEGTFDGNGHTISNFYQNTWEMFGDYNSGYSGTPNHYKDAMGLFGYVVNGKVENLTVDNFSSDGEFTPTGVIAAYAVNSTFENIAITNCNPRVYNTGNGGIVGIGGNSDDPDTYKLTFTNITIDNSNKITALWGSWDVACGGLVGMFRGAGHVHMTNCHVAAQIDVYNDVCGNYQYYWYRYSGMMVGTNKNMTTDANGYTVPETDKFHAENCTVHFGEWNDYYYCELVANSLASYTHDHQFSRLDQIQNVSEIQDENGNWDKTGNYILMNGKTPTNTCYHIMKDANGNLYEHKHDVADATNKEINETVNGETVLKENNQRIYLPFNQLFTGYGWGVKHIPVYNGEDYAFDGITILDREEGNSVEKFEGKVTELANNKEYKLGDIFSFVGNGVELVPGALIVAVTNLAENNPVSATIVYDRNNWENSTITFNGAGKIKLTIQDYHFCTPTTIDVTITERVEEEKFDIVMNNGDFLHRVGNSGTVALDKLFAAKNDTSVGNVEVTIETVDNTGATGTYTSNATWTNGAIQFSGTGVVKVTITDNDYCIPTELYLEVVDAVNATSATNATKSNVVLLQNCGFSSLEVSGGYTLYGNGFTMTCSSDSAALDTGYEFVALNNGTLDNVQIVCPNFDYAVLYSSNMTEAGNRKETTDKTRYFNVKSGVMASGNSQILNSRISGARAAVNASGGNLVIDNSRIELGAVASILVGAANSVTLRDVTLIQKPTASTHDSSKTLMGFSVLFVCDANGDAAPMTVEGTLVQNAWIDENDKQYVPSAGQSIVSTVLAKTEYLHDIDGDGTKESLNLGFAYMPESLTSKVNATTITDERTNKDTVPYDYAEVSILTGKTYVYSYKNTNETDNSFKTDDVYVPNRYSDNIVVNYSDTADGLTTGKSFDTDGWVYELNVDLDKLSGYALDFSKLSMSVNGVAVTDFKVNDSAKPTSPVAVTAGGTTYTLTATVNGKEYTATYKVTGTETSKESPSLVASNYEAGLCVASSYGGTWHGAAPALEGIQIKYWSVAEKQYKTITLSDYTPTTPGKQNGTNTTWTYSPDNGDFTLTLTGGQVHSKNGVYAMPVVCDGKLYFVAASSNGLVNTGNSARTIPVSYSFKDNNNGDVLTFSHTWSVAENKDAQYNYSDFCDGTLTPLKSGSGSGGGCVTPDTLITLANGKQVRVDSLTGTEQLLVWNMETGKLDSAPILFVDSESEAEFEIVHLYFSDGTDVKVISEHGFWDYNLNKYVYLDANAAQYIGHTFAKQSGSKLTKVRLTDVVLETEVTTAWSPVTEGHLCYFVNGMLSMPGGVGGLFNIFDVNAKTMTYDYAAMERDIAKYGLFTYEELNAIVPLSEEMFNAAGGAYLKVSIGKGNLTMDELIAMIQRYSVYFE